MPGIAAWEALPEPTRQRGGGLKVLHSRARLSRETFRDASEEQCQAEAARFPDVIHPLVRTHPESGRRGLYLGSEWDEGKYSRRLHRLILLNERRPE